MPNFKDRQVRGGIASFELVISFPVLMFLIAMLYTVYVATQKKSQLMMEVRHNAWLVRSTPTAAKSQMPFGILNAHSSGESRQELTRQVNTYRRWYPNVPRKIEWGNVVLAGSWDHRQVKFADKGFSPIYPHFDVLLQMVGAQGGVPANSGQVSQLGQLTNVPGLP